MIFLMKNFIYFLNLGLCCTECGKVVDDTLEQFDNPAHLGVTSTPGEKIFYIF